MNGLEIVQNNDANNIQLDSGDYDINELFEGICAVYNEKGVMINIMINKNNNVVISCDDEIMLNVDETSLAKLLGFDEGEYMGTKIIASNKCVWNKYYMYIVNIYENEPICEIYSNGKHKMLNNTFSNLISQFEGMIVQFKLTDGNLIDFKGRSHQFELEISQN